MTDNNKTLFRKALSLILAAVLVLSPSVAMATDNVGSDLTISDNNTQQHDFTADGVTLTVNGSIQYADGNDAVMLNNRTNATVIVNSGATVAATFADRSHFTPRDLRRTAVSLMTAVNVELSAVAKVLNQAVSNTPSDDEEKRKALTLLGNCLELIINGDPIFEI